MRKAPSYKLSYIQNYDTNNTDQTIAGTFLQKSHQLLEQTLPKVGNVRRVLEVGAGSGHHLPYVSKNFQQYVKLVIGDNEVKYEEANDRWEYAVSLSTVGEFYQLSFLL